MPAHEETLDEVGHDHRTPLEGHDPWDALEGHDPQNAETLHNGDALLRPQQRGTLENLEEAPHNNKQSMKQRPLHGKGGRLDRTDHCDGAKGKSIPHNVMDEHKEMRPTRQERQHHQGQVNVTDQKERCQLPEEDQREHRQKEEDQPASPRLSNYQLLEED